MTKKSEFWSDTLVKKLKELYLEQGKTATEIAKIFDTTKNAIIGKIHRLGLNTLKDKDDEQKTKATPIGSFKLSEIKSNMCLWAEGDDKDIVFCGDKAVIGEQYCTKHVAEVYLHYKKTNGEE